MLTVNKGPEAYDHDGLPLDDDENKGAAGSTRLAMPDIEPGRQEAQRQQRQDPTEPDFPGCSTSVMFEGQLAV